MTSAAFKADAVVCSEYRNGVLTREQWSNGFVDLLHISESDFKRRCSSYSSGQLFMSWKTSGVTGDAASWPGTQMEENGHFPALAGLSPEKDPPMSFVFTVC
jgi:hypothetical protein